MAILTTLTALYLIISGIQYWITDYVQSVLGNTKEQAFMIYILVGALGPVLGVAFSGVIFDRIGGYHGRKTPALFTCFLLVSASLGIVSVIWANVYICCACILLQLFFGGLCVPVLTGYMIAQVPNKMRTNANSLANMFYNLLGFFPAPSIYGIVYQSFGSGESRMGLFSIQAFGLGALFFLLPSVIRRKVRDKKEMKELMALQDKIVEPCSPEKAKALGKDKEPDSDELFQRA